MTHNQPILFKIAMVMLCYVILSTPLQARKHLHLEKFYQKVAANKLNGEMEHRLTNRTRVDILTSKNAIEVDFAHKCYESIGQSLYYAYRTGKKPGIVLIIENPKLDAPYLTICREMSKHKSIDLWIITPSLNLKKLSH